MPITSAIVETREGAEEDILRSLARFPQVNVYGVHKQKIVAVIEGATASEIEQVVVSLAAIDDVVGVFPVFAGNYD